MAKQGITMTVEEFYKGKAVFLTGGTGFIGKVIIEKLLREVPDMETIYLLVREKKGRNIHERLQTILNCMLFDKLRGLMTMEELEKKIVPIKGNCMEIGLGLSEEDRNLLIANVSIVIHAAASVRFNDPLRTAVLMNTRSTREVAQLALEIPRLAIFVYISTTYCNCVVSRSVNEVLYPAPADWRQTIEIAERFDAERLEELSNKYLGPYPNTYTFTKALSEHVVNDMCAGKFPVVICRPSIVVSSLEDPVPGWIDNFNGPVSLLVACGKGLLRSSYLFKNVYADFVPVDVIVRMIIVATWNVAQRGECAFDILQCCSGNFKWLTLGEVIETSRLLASEVPFNNSLWVPKGGVTTCAFLAYVNVILFHLIPALFLDMGLRFYGHKPILVKLQSRIYGAALQLRYFTSNDWDFNNTKIMELETHIPQKKFINWRYDFRDENVDEYLKAAMRGARLYLLKESDETLPAAKVHYNRMYWLDKFAMLILYSSIFYLLYKFNILSFVYIKLYNFFTSIFLLN